MLQNCLLTEARRNLVSTVLRNVPFPVVKTKRLAKDDLAPVGDQNRPGKQPGIRCCPAQILQGHHFVGTGLTVSAGEFLFCSPGVAERPRHEQAQHWKAMISYFWKNH